MATEFAGRVRFKLGKFERGVLSSPIEEQRGTDGGTYTLSRAEVIDLARNLVPEWDHVKLDTGLDDQMYKGKISLPDGTKITIELRARNYRSAEIPGGYRILAISSKTGIMNNPDMVETDEEIVGLWKHCEQNRHMAVQKAVSDEAVQKLQARREAETIVIRDLLGSVVRTTQ